MCESGVLLVRSLVCHLHDHHLLRLPKTLMDSIEQQSLLAVDRWDHLSDVSKSTMWYQNVTAHAMAWMETADRKQKFCYPFRRPAVSAHMDFEQGEPARSTPVFT